MDGWGRTYETDVQSHLESPPSLCRTLPGGGPSSSRGAGRGRQGWEGSRRWAVPSPKSSLVPGKGLGVGPPECWCLACLALCHRLSPRSALQSEHGAGGLRWRYSLPLINARLLPSCDSLSISVATRLFLRKGNCHDSVGFKVVILYCVAQKA